MASRRIPLNIFPKILLYMAFLLIKMGLAIELEGSQTSYARYPKWNPCQNGSLTFEFKTSQPNGLLLYSDDGGKFDFVEVKLVDGMVRLRLNLGERHETSILTVGQELNDKRWHKVEVSRNHQETSLKVDNIEQSRNSKGAEYAFGNYSQNNYVFIGGMPIAYSAKLSLLALPSVMFEPRFRGSIRNLLYSDCGRSADRKDMLDSKGVRTNDLDLCEQENPCENGGICISTDTGSLCDCSSTDFEGQNCEAEKIPSEATFYGAHYLSYDLSSHGDPIVSSNDQVTLYFKTRQPNGLLFYTGDGNDYMNIALREGGIAMSLNLGSGVFETEVKPKRGTIRFDDNKWHKLIITREAREVTVQVDDMYKRTGTTVGDFTMLSSKELFVGGSSNVAELQGSKVKDNFRGCLRKVIYKADSINLDLTDLARNSHNLIHVHGDILFNKCEDLVQSQPITFTTEEAFVKVPQWNTAKSGKLEFQFRTNEPNGLVMYSRGSMSTSDFFAIEILEGYLYVMLDLGSGPLKVKGREAKVNDGLPHKVALEHKGATGKISVDGVSVAYEMAGDSDQLDLEGAMFIGGINSLDGFLNIPTSVWSAMLRHGYVGCMQDLVMNGEKIDLAGLGRQQGVEGVKEYCRVMEPHCMSQPCMHRGECQEGWNRYACDCSATGYISATCNEVATTLSFDGTQYMRITMPEESRTEAEDISLRFKTRRSNGLLFATTSTKTSDRVELMLEGGQVRWDVNLGSGTKTVLAGRGLDDDHWHTVHLRRRAKRLHLQVDRKTPTEAEMEGNSKIVEFDKIELAKRPQGDDPNVKLKAKENFVGHMQQFVFNGNHFFEMARTGEIQNIDTTAHFNKKEHLVNFPITFHTTQAYLSTRLRIYSTFTILFQIKTTQPDGLIMYCGGGEGKDFFVIELVNGHIWYIYDTGGGPRTMKATLGKPINDNKWHEVRILRRSLQQTILYVDESATYDNLRNTRSVHFDTDDQVYIGGAVQDVFGILPKKVKSREGFQGCLASIDLNGDNRNILEHRAEIPDEYRNEISEGCQGTFFQDRGPATECSSQACANGGVCIQEWNSFRCDCAMTTFSGDLCDEDSIAYTFGGEGGLILFTYPEGLRPDRRKDELALGFITTQRDAVIARINSGVSSDYIEMEIIDGHVFVVYNMGTMDHPIGELFQKVNDGNYHVVRFSRSGPNSTIQVDNNQIQTKNPTGQQLSVFNNQAFIQVGGKKDQRGKLMRPFQGIIAGLVFNNERILNHAAVGDRRITIEGDVVLEIAPLRPSSGITSVPSRPVIGTPAPGDTSTPGMQSTMGTTPRGDGVTDDIIFSGAGSGCSTDDEDDCSNAGSGDKDALIRPSVKIRTTPRPPHPTRQAYPTPTPRSMRTTEPSPLQWGSGEGPCGDDEDCEGSGSGAPVEPVHTPKVTTDDIYLTSPEPTKKDPWAGHEDKYPWKPDNNRPDVGFPAPKTTQDSLVITVNMTETPLKRNPHVTPRRPYGHSTETPGGKQNTNNQIPKGSEVNQKHSGLDTLSLNIGLIVGIAAGVLLLLLILAYALYKYKSRDEGSYKIDESKNYPYESPVSKPSPTANGGFPKSGMQPSSKPPKKKDVKEWYV